MNGIVLAGKIAILCDSLVGNDTGRPICRRRVDEIRFSARLRPRVSRRSSAHSLRSTTNGHECSSCPGRTRSAHLRSSGVQYPRELASRRWCAGASLFARCVRPLASCSLLPPRLLALVPGAPRGPRMANCLAEGRLRLDRLTATAAGRLFFPGRATPRKTRGPRPTAFLAQTKKVSGLPSSAALRPFGLSLFDKPSRNDLHPTMKPVALVERHPQLVQEPRHRARSIRRLWHHTDRGRANRAPGAADRARSEIRRCDRRALARIEGEARLAQTNLPFRASDTTQHRMRPNGDERSRGVYRPIKSITIVALLRPIAAQR